MIKILGALLILCASVCTCAFYEKNEKKKLASAIECCEFIRFIKSQIEYFSTPVEKIFSLYNKDKECSAAITGFIHKSTDDIRACFEKEDFTLINEFFSSLGKGMKNEELALCSYTIETLEKNIEKKKADYPDKIKVFRAITLFIGICIIILLI